MRTGHRVESRGGHCLAEQIIRGFDFGFGGGLPLTGDFADANQARPFMIVREPADVGRERGRSGLDTSVIGIHRGIGVPSLTRGTVQIEADIRVERALIALQRQRIIAAPAFALRHTHM
jgi:hypothetical protein